eukprot:358720-Prorocentrum_lima.AAC.1
MCIRDRIVPAVWRLSPPRIVPAVWRLSPVLLCYTTPLGPEYKSSAHTGKLEGSENGPTSFQCQ